jgi:hypothetical protein
MSPYRLCVESEALTINTMLGQTRVEMEDVTKVGTQVTPYGRTLSFVLRPPNRRGLALLLGRFGNSQELINEIVRMASEKNPSIDIDPKLLANIGKT